MIIMSPLPSNIRRIAVITSHAALSLYTVCTTVNVRPVRAFSTTASTAFFTKTPSSPHRYLSRTDWKKEFPRRRLEMSSSVVSDQKKSSPVSGELISLDSGTDGQSFAAIRIRDGDLDNKDGRGGGQGDDFTGRSVEFTVTDTNGNTKSHKGMVIAQRPPILFAYSKFNEQTSIPNKEDVTITVLNEKTSLQFSPQNIFGKVLDCFFEAEGEDVLTRDILAPIPQVSEIELINSPLLTGITAVDALAPIGKGQNMLIVGESGTGKRNLVMNTIAMQCQNTKCIYASTFPKKEVMEDLVSRDLLKDVVLVASNSEEGAAAAAEGVTVSFTACAIAEALAKDGQDCLVVIDDVDHHKQLWDWTTRTLLKEYGEEAVIQADVDGGAASSEMRGFYSNLVQRSCNLKNGGSVTLLLLASLPPPHHETEDGTIIFTEEDFEEGYPDKIKTRIRTLIQNNIPITPVTLQKLQIPIPSSDQTQRSAMHHIEDLISMSDGQIWLDSKFAKKGVQPPLDPSRSITRIGIGADTASRADAKALQSLAAGLRVKLAQAMDMAAGSDTDKQRKRANAYLFAMYQHPTEIRSLGQTCIALIAAKLGLLDEFLLNRDDTVIVQNLLEHVENAVPDAVEKVNETQDLTDGDYEVLVEEIQRYFSSLE